jgi:cytoskeleton protein RodZ
MTFSEDCWVDVTDVDRNRLAYGVIQANSVETLNGKPPFRIILGNAVAVTMEMNGKTVDRSVYIPARGTVSRFTLGEVTPQPTSQQRE